MEATLITRALDVRDATWLASRLCEARAWVWYVPITFALGATCLVIAFVPGSHQDLEWRRAAAESGQWWRFATGHLTHFDAQHLAWDLAVFLVLGSLCETRHRVRYAVVLILCGLLIPMALSTLSPEIATYRGLSGLDTALFAMLAAGTLQAARRRRDWVLLTTVSGLFALLLAKMAYEAWTSSTLFVDTASAGFKPVPLAHLVGAAVGMTIGFLDTLAARRARATSIP
jgi:rhomboid family GlyGly-CTERM serine protease